MGPQHLDQETQDDDDVKSLLTVLPKYVSESILDLPDRTNLLEVVLDFGRKPEARLVGRKVVIPRYVSREDLDAVLKAIGEFGDDNRAGVERTLHRISAMRNKRGKVIGLTCRVGRAVLNTVVVVRDIIVSGRSVLILGKPGAGKTTLLREAARVLSEERRVVIVDTSNEIGGDGDIPHQAIGDARRMQVPSRTMQQAVMVEAVENHMPEVIIIDEIGTEAEAAAARTIAERGVQLVATAHGSSLENLVRNPALNDLVGGVHTVTLSDDEARRRRVQKSVLERKSAPTFDVVVVVDSWSLALEHANVASAVDAILRGEPFVPTMRILDSEGNLHVSPGTDGQEALRASRPPGNSRSSVTSQTVGGSRTRKAGRKGRRRRTRRSQAKR